MKAKQPVLPKIIMVVVLSLLGLLIAHGIYMIHTIASCWPKIREVGDFIVRFYDNSCDIHGTTEQGNSKKFLVIPEYIDGVRVRALGEHNLLGALNYPKIESENLEKIYFESEAECYEHIKSINRPNLKKIIYLNTSNYSGKINCDVYYPRSIYEQESGIEYYSNVHPANVSFYYNYTDAKNSGYYWIDDCDYGSKIEYIPKAPTRDGYTFGGWYKEPECINKWDFDVDTLPEKQTEQKEVDKNGETITEEVTIYQETILYAKWL